MNCCRINIHIPKIEIGRPKQNKSTNVIADERAEVGGAMPCHKVIRHIVTIGNAEEPHAQDNKAVVSEYKPGRKS